MAENISVQLHWGVPASTLFDPVHFRVGGILPTSADRF
jgi:hypothetical protein